MIQLFRLFFDICLLQRGPRDVPASRWLFHFTVLAYLGSSLLLLVLDGGPFWQSVVKAALDLAVLMGIVQGVLYWRRLQDRVLQTLTALLGTGVVLALIALPVVRWLYLGAASGQVEALPAMLWLVMLVWNIVVIGHIMRHALEVQMVWGVLVGMGYLTVSVTLIELLFPTAG